MGNYRIKYDKTSPSWTKYDIVRTLDVVYSEKSIQDYMSGKAKINHVILCSFLGIRSLEDSIPYYWIEIQKYPEEKKIFALLAAILMHNDIIQLFVTKYAKKNMQGEFYIDENNGSNKMQTNIRSLLVESEVTPPTNRRKKSGVHYDLSRIFYNPRIGLLFKDVLLERMSRVCDISDITNDDFYEFCFFNQFHIAISLSEDLFKAWLEGEQFSANYIQQLTISRFLTISESINLNFEDSKEIYLLGENGDGKSLILMALYLAFNGNFILNETDTQDTGSAIDLMKESELYGQDRMGYDFNIKNAIYLKNLYAYGTHRGRRSAEPSEKYGFMSLFGSEYTLMDPVQWLKNIKLDEDKQDSQSYVKIATTTLCDSLNKILGKNITINIDGSNVSFIEKGISLTLDQLSEGYRSIIIFVCDLIYRLYMNNESDILKTKAVVLIDEIDLHLHVKWQREIVGLLRSVFPNTQFIFTTHSPSVIQGALEDAILFRTYREDGQTKVSEPYYRKDLNHLMMNTLITSSIFGMGDSRMNTENNEADTSDTYVLHRLNKRIEQHLKELKQLGNIFISDDKIDSMIDTILKEEEQNDKG